MATKFHLVLLQSFLFMLFLCGSVGSSGDFRWLKDLKHIGSMNGSDKISLVIALKQRNVQELEKIFWQVSDPLSVEYGNYKSSHQLRELIGVQEKNLSILLNWLTSFGVDQSQVHLADTRDLVRLSLSVDQAQAMFQSKILIYSHKSGRRVARASSNIILPPEIEEMVEFVGGLTTPIHSYRQARQYEAGSDDLIQEIESVLERKNEFNTSDSPIIVNIKVGVVARLAFIFVCKNGQVNNISPPLLPCSSLPNSEIKQLRVFLRTKNFIQTFDIAYSAMECKLHSIQHVTICEFGVPFFVTYTRVQISARSIFSGGIESTESEVKEFVLMKYTTPHFLKELYGIPSGLSVTHPRSNQAVASFLEEYYNPNDLYEFTLLMGLDPIHLDKLVGPNDQENPGGEASLDIQVMIFCDMCFTWKGK